MNQACAKCRQYVALGRDSWCVGCSALESCQLELSGEWTGPVGLRRIANDLCLNAAREVRALRALGAGISRAPEVRSSGVAEAKESAAPKAVAGTAPKVKAEKRSEGSSEEYTYEESEDAPARGPAVKEESDSRPVLPRRRPEEGAVDPSPKRSRREESSEETRRRRKEDKARDFVEKEKSRENRRKEKDGKEKSGEEEKKKKKKRKRKRGGRKHQRLGRLAADPYLRHHRKLTPGFLDTRPDWDDL